MQSPLALFDLSVRSAWIPVAAAAVAGLSFLLLRGRLFHFRPFGTSDSESVMTFSSLGTLRCICGADRQEGGWAERRSFCRGCGCEVVARNHAMLDKQLTGREIEHMIRSLRRTAIRASRLQLPPSVTTLAELQRYLDAGHEIPGKVPPPPPVEQPQIQ